MLLRLCGRLSYVDQRMHFVFDEDVEIGLGSPDTWSHAKLARACNAGAKPYTREGFTVVMPRGRGDISEFIGRDCTVHVKVTPYKFVSTYEQNRGETVTGHKLVLVDIALMT